MARMRISSTKPFLSPGLNVEEVPEGGASAAVACASAFTANDLRGITLATIPKRAELCLLDSTRELTREETELLNSAWKAMARRVEEP